MPDGDLPFFADNGIIQEQRQQFDKFNVLNVGILFEQLHKSIQMKLCSIFFSFLFVFLLPMFSKLSFKKKNR